MSNLLINKFKGKYTLRTEFDAESNEFTRKLNGTYEDIDVYIKCKHDCKIFHYGNKNLQFYCPSIVRGKSIVRSIYGQFINPNNVKQRTLEYDTFRNGNKYHISKNVIDIVDMDIFDADMQGNNIIYDLEITDEEVLFKFKYTDLEKLKEILQPLMTSCNRSPFSVKNLNKSNYKIPEKELKQYSILIEKIPISKRIKLTHISLKFLSTICKNEKRVEELNMQRKKLGMKPKEFYHYMGKWEDYISYLTEEITNVN